MRTLLSAALLLTTFGTSPLLAATQAYYDREAFFAAVSGTTAVTFNSQAADSFTNRGRDYTLDGVRFLNQSANIFTVGNQADPSFSGGNQFGSSYLTFSNGNNIAIILPGPVNAIGFDFIELRARSGTFGAGLENGPSFEFTSLSTPEFFGIVTDEPSNVFTIGASNTTIPAIDNVTYRLAVAPVPEPASWAMMIAGFGLAGGALRRSRKLRATSVKVSIA